jgi:hypothetical protein
MSLRKAAVVLALTAAIALASSSVATGDVPRTGDQHVGIFACAFSPPCDEITLTADEAFFVAHGFSGEPKEDLLNPGHRFELRVDGALVHGALDLDLAASSKTYVFNFRAGMTGTHAFTGCWYATDGSLTACGTRVVHFV